MSPAWLALPPGDFFINSALIMASLRVPTCQVSADQAASGCHRPQGHIEQIDGQLVVEWGDKVVTLETRRILGPDGKVREIETQVLHFSKGVKATFGQTTLAAEEMELRLDSEDRTGLAKGNVLLTDPEGKVEASVLDFQWREGTAHAQDAYVRVGSIGLRASEIRISPEQWTILSAELDPNVGGLKVYSLNSPWVSVRPGETIVAKRLGISLFGRRIVVIPMLKQSLRQGAKGMRLPVPSLKSGGRPSLSWDGDFNFGGKWLLSGAFSLVQHRKSSALAGLTYDLSGAEHGAELSSPRSSLSDPLPYGYFDNIGVQGPDKERSSTGARHETLSIESSTLQRVVGRSAIETASQPWSLIYDVGGQSRGFAGSLQMRYGEIESLSGAAIKRGEAVAALVLPSVSLTKSLFTVTRLDGRAFAQPSGPFAWVRLEGGLVFQPIDWLRLGGSYAAGGESGTPGFDFDRPFVTHSFALRSDLFLGPTTFSYMQKFDTDRRKWYDQEIAVRQVAGSLSPYVIWRQFPRRLSIGIELRTLDVVDRLKQRFKKSAQK